MDDDLTFVLVTMVELFSCLAASSPNAMSEAPLGIPTVGMQDDQPGWIAPKHVADDQDAL